ncbi:MAG: diacylglycerol kinase family protein [Pikeienuella sp.]
MTALTGHIRNEKATQNAKKHAERDGPAPGDMVCGPRSFEELDATLAEMRDAGISRLIISGGDGTVREVLSRAPEIWGDAPLPHYIICPTGNTNLIARKTGGAKGRELNRLWRAGDAALRQRTLRLLTVRRKDRRTLRGAIMGIGAYEVATRIAREEISARHGAQVALAVLNLLRSDEMRDGLMCRIGHDNARGGYRQRMLFGVTTLPGRLISRFEPFWGDQSRPLRWLDIDARPKALMRAAPHLAFGTPKPWMAADYHSGSSRSIVIETAAQFVMDGEAFDTGSDGLISLSATETATFLTLP